jgi:hypothetical protein
MKTRAVRAGSLLVGVASLLVLPGVASGQIDVGKTVGDAVGEVGKAVPPVAPPAPVQVPAAPVQPPAPAQPAPNQAPSSAPAAPPPGPAGGGGGSASSAPAGGSVSSGGAPNSRGASGSRGGVSRSQAGGGGGATAKASGAGSKSGRNTVLAAQDPGTLTPAGGEDFSGAVTTNPDTGVQGDPELPFTGLQVLLLLAMGAAALATGVGLRTAARRRHAG